MKASGARAKTQRSGVLSSCAATRTARAVLHALAGTTTDGVVVTRVRFTGHLRAPDTALEPARERVVLTAQLMLRPA